MRRGLIGGGGLALKWQRESKVYTHKNHDRGPSSNQSGVQKPAPPSRMRGSGRGL